MPKLVCITCQTELKPFKNGTTVIEMASFGPYKVWDADTWKCPGCGYKIVAGFANNPARQDHWAKDFPAWLENLKATAEHIVYDFEKPTYASGDLFQPGEYKAELNETQREEIENAEEEG